MPTNVAMQEEEFTGRANWRRWSRIVRHAMTHKWHLLGIIGCALVLAMMDVTFPLLTRGIIDDAIAKRGHTLKWYALAYFSMAMFFAAVVRTFITLGGKLTTHVSYDLRQEAFSHMQDLSFSYFDRRPVGWLMARLTGDCDRLSRVIAWGTLDIVWGTSMLIFVCGMMLYINLICGLIVLSVLPLLVWMGLYFQKRILRTSRAMRRANSELTANYNEGIMGARTTKTLAREADALGEFQGLSRKMQSASISNALYRAMYMPLVFSVANLGVGLVLWHGGGQVIEHLKDTTVGMSPGTLAAFMSYCSFFFFPVHEIARVLTEVQAAQAATERIVGVLETEPEIADSPEVLQAIGHHRDTAALGATAEDGLPDTIETIEFRNVSFSYLEGPPVLRDFNLKVQAGQSIALVGPTGGGKTTIVSLLCRFYEPTSGEILINGVDYRRRSLGWLQSKLGIVLQTPHLFSGTTRENIRYGRLEASDEEVEQAAKMVGAHEFIVAAESGYDTEVGQGGGRLSTGQRQLVSFARAVLADPAIFVMDEATSSVDAESVGRLHSAYRRRAGRGAGHAPPIALTGRAVLRAVHTAVSTRAGRQHPRPVAGIPASGESVPSRAVVNAARMQPNVR